MARSQLLSAKQWRKTKATADVSGTSLRTTSTASSSSRSCAHTIVKKYRRIRFKKTMIVQLITPRRRISGEAVGMRMPSPTKAYDVTESLNRLEKQLGELGSSEEVLIYGSPCPQIEGRVVLKLPLHDPAGGLKLDTKRRKGESTAEDTLEKRLDTETGGQEPQQLPQKPVTTTAKDEPLREREQEEKTGKKRENAKMVKPPRCKKPFLSTLPTSTHGMTTRRRTAQGASASSSEENETGKVESEDRELSVGEFDKSRIRRRTITPRRRPQTLLSCDGRTVTESLSEEAVPSTWDSASSTAANYFPIFKSRSPAVSSKTILNKFLASVEKQEELDSTLEREREASEAQMKENSEKRDALVGCLSNRAVLEGSEHATVEVTEEQKENDAPPDLEGGASEKAVSVKKSRRSKLFGVADAEEKEGRDEGQPKATPLLVATEHIGPKTRRRSTFFFKPQPLDDGEQPQDEKPLSSARRSCLLGPPVKNEVKTSSSSAEPPDCSSADVPLEEDQTIVRKGRRSGFFPLFALGEEKEQQEAEHAQIATDEMREGNVKATSQETSEEKAERMDNLPIAVRRTRRSSFFEPRKKPESSLKKKEKRLSSAVLSRGELEPKKQKTGKETMEKLKEEPELVCLDESGEEADVSSVDSTTSTSRKSSTAQHVRWLAELDSAPFSFFNAMDEAECTTAEELKQIYTKKKAPELELSKVTTMTYEQPKSERLNAFFKEPLNQIRNSMTADETMFETLDDTTSREDRAALDKQMMLSDEVKRVAMTNQDWGRALRPRNTVEFLGSKDAVKETENFVRQWMRRLDRQTDRGSSVDSQKKNSRKSRRKGSSESDSDYDGEEDPTGEPLPNPLILRGHPGSGKTALVYAVCEELGLKVLEVAPNERRNAATLRQKIAGALHSHRVVRAADVASFFSPKRLGNSAPSSPTVAKKEGTCLTPRREHTLILVEHVDVVFADEERDFLSTLRSTADESKVPMVWTCEEWPRGVEMPDSAVDVFVTGPEREELASYIKKVTLEMTGKSLSEVFVNMAAERHDLRAALFDCKTAAAGTIHWTPARDLFIRPLPREDLNRKLEGCLDSTAPIRIPLFKAEDLLPQLVEDLTLMEAVRISEARSDLAATYQQWEHVEDERVRQTLKEQRWLTVAVRREQSARSALAASQTPRHALEWTESATELLPILAEMDEHERRRRKVTPRRGFIHYFHRLNDGKMVDPTNCIRLALDEMRWPQRKSEIEVN